MRVTAEKRWFWKDACPPELAAWFEKSGLPPGGGGVRIDEYLFDRDQKEIGIKKRGNKREVELKGLVGIEDVGSAAGLGGRVEIWCKWSSQALELKDSPTLKVEKLRRLRKFSTDQGFVAEIGLDENERPVDASRPQQEVDIELSSLRVGEHGDRWWTFGVEASGSLSSAASNFQKVVETLAVFPGRALKGAGEMSYPGWLAGLQGPGKIPRSR
jgi:hypothetical protein